MAPPSAYRTHSQTSHQKGHTSCTRSNKPPVPSDAIWQQNRRTIGLGLRTVPYSTGLKTPPGDVFSFAYTAVLLRLHGR